MQGLISISECAFVDPGVTEISLPSAHTHAPEISSPGTQAALPHGIWHGLSPTCHSHCSLLCSFTQRLPVPQDWWALFFLSLLPQPWEG